MKQFILILLCTVLMFTVGCKKEDPVTPATKSLTAAETDLIGTWDHDSTVQNGFYIPPSCTGARIEFLSTDYDLDVENLDYDFTDNRSCINITNGWSAPSSSTLYAGNVEYNIVTLSTTALVINQTGSTNFEYYTKQ